MRMYPSTFLLAVLAMAFMYGPDVEAQRIPSPYTYLERGQEIGFFGGQMSSGSGRFGYAPAGGPIMGLRYGVELAGPLALEGMAGIVNSTRDVVDPGRVEGDRVIGEADARLATIDARFRFSFTGRRAWHRLSPFITGGGGIVFDTSGRSELDDVLLAADVFEMGTSFFGTLGFGTRWFLTDTFALRADGVFSLWQVDTPPGFSEPARGFESVEDGEWLPGSSFSVTLLYRW